MTVAITTSKNVYAGDGVNTLFPYTFPIIASSDIQVYVTDVLGNITLLGSGYTVDTANSRVVYPSSGAALGVGTKITLSRAVPYTQTTDWKNQGPFNAELLETDEDKLTMLVQQLKESLDRCVKYGVDQTVSDTTTATILASLNAAVLALANVQTMTYLTPTANGPNTSSCAVAAGKFMKSDGTSVITFPGGQSPAFAVVAANSRIDLLCIDDTNALSITQGVQAASPVPPLYPSGKTVIAEITITETSGVAISTADIKDVRPFLEGTFSQAYVDATLWKAPVKVATTTPLAANTYANGTSGYGATLTATANGAIANVDGVALAAGDRILVKNEVAGANNGIYTVTQLGTGGTPYILTRALDSCVPAALAVGARVFAQQGTANALGMFTQTTTGAITIGTTALSFRYENYLKLLGWKKPDLQKIGASNVGLVTGSDGVAGEVAMLFRNGTLRVDSTSGDFNCDLTRVAAFSSGTIQSGVRTGAVVANTWYSFFAVGVTKPGSEDRFVLIADASDYKATSLATYDGFWGAGNWQYMGTIPYGDNSAATTTVPDFVMHGNQVAFFNACSMGGRSCVGVRLANTAGATSLTWTYAAGTALGSAQVPSNLLIGTLVTSNEAATESYLTDSTGNIQYLGFSVSAGLNALRVSNLYLGLGARLLTGSSVAQGLGLAGYVDSALGVGVLPLF